MRQAGLARPSQALTPGPAAAQRRRLIVSKWAGHYDAAFTQRTYVHASTEDLDRARKALARIDKIV